MGRVRSRDWAKEHPGPEGTGERLSEKRLPRARGARRAVSPGRCCDGPHGSSDAGALGGLARGLSGSMQDLTAQVTSDLLHFPEVTIEALGEDEITLESVLRGKFAAGKNGLACLACGPQLEVVNSLTGERLSAYRFSGVNEQPPVVLAVKNSLGIRGLDC